MMIFFCLLFDALNSMGAIRFSALNSPPWVETSFRGIVHQKKYKLTLHQLQDPDDEPLGEAITKVMIQGLRRVVENEGFNVRDYSLLVAVHSNSFTRLVSISPKCPIRGVVK